MRVYTTLAQDVMGQALSELSAPARNLLAQLHAMVKNHCEQAGIQAGDYIFTRRTIRDYTGWSDWQVRTHIRELVALEYIKCRVGTWGKEYVYELLYDGEGVDGERFCLALTDPDTLVEPD